MFLGFRRYVSLQDAASCEMYNVMLCSRAGTVDPARGRYFPPKLNVLLAWSTLFRSEGTWGNYLAYVKTATVMVEASTQVAR